MFRYTQNISHMTSLLMVTSIDSIQKSPKNNQKLGQELNRLEDDKKFKNEKKEIKLLS